MVDVSKVFPTKIKITVKEAEKWFLVSQDGVTAAVSRMGRIVELGSESGLPTIVGYDAVELTPGATLTSSENGKTQLPASDPRKGGALRDNRNNPCGPHRQI